MCNYAQTAHVFGYLIYKVSQLIRSSIPTCLRVQLNAPWHILNRGSCQICKADQCTVTQRDRCSYWRYSGWVGSPYTVLQAPSLYEHNLLLAAYMTSYRSWLVQIQLLIVLQRNVFCWQALTTEEKKHDILKYALSNLYLYTRGLFKCETLYLVCGTELLCIWQYWSAIRLVSFEPHSWIKCQALNQPFPLPYLWSKPRLYSIIHPEKSKLKTYTHLSSSDNDDTSAGH